MKIKIRKFKLKKDKANASNHPYQNDLRNLHEMVRITTLSSISIASVAPGYLDIIKTVKENA